MPAPGTLGRGRRAVNQGRTRWGLVGDLRSQVSAAVVGTCLLGSIALAHGGSERLRADMSGSQEVTTPPGGFTDPDSTGRAKVEITFGEGDEVLLHDQVR